MKSQEKKRHGAGRVAFVARKDAIKERLDAGYSMAHIYDDYQESLGISYSQFTNYVNKYLRNKPPTTQKEKPKHDENRTEAPRNDAPPARTETRKKPEEEPTPADDSELERNARRGDFF